MIYKGVRGSGVLSKMASAAPESLTIQKQITESLWTSQCFRKEARDEIVIGVCYRLPSYIKG